MNENNPQLQTEIAAIGFPADPAIDAETERIYRRFPWGYGLTPAVGYNRGAAKPFEARLYRCGKHPLSFGDYSTEIEATAAIVNHTRAHVAAKIREYRKLPRPPKFPRLRKRQPWRFTEGGAA